MKIRIGEQVIVVGKEVEREGGRVVLAHGEVTGHAHAIADKAATLYASPGSNEAALALGTRILKTLAPVALNHEEHSTVHVPKGVWGVRIQRQYDGNFARQVED